MENVEGKNDKNLKFLERKSFLDEIKSFSVIFEMLFLVRYKK